MAQTYDAIASYTFGSAASSYTFSSIAASWTDLILVFNCSFATADGLTLQFNTDTSGSGTNYSHTYVGGDGTSAISGRVSNSFGMTMGYVNTSQSTTIIHIFNYANATTYKTALSRDNSTTYVLSRVGLWRKTPEAITSIKLFGANGYNFNSGTTMTLYGVKSA
jgi:hypothetical protein